jgi:hypothetical protein
MWNARIWGVEKVSSEMRVARLFARMIDSALCSSGFPALPFARTVNERRGHATAMPRREMASVSSETRSCRAKISRFYGFADAESARNTAQSLSNSMRWAFGKPNGKAYASAAPQSTCLNALLAPDEWYAIFILSRVFEGAAAN